MELTYDNLEKLIYYLDEDGEGDLWSDKHENHVDVDGTIYRHAVDKFLKENPS